MSDTVKKITGWLLFFAVCIGISFFISRVIIVVFPVAGESMEPNVFEGNVVLSRLSTPKRGDVVVLRTPQIVFEIDTTGNPPHPPQFMIKRVIGLPGDTIEIKADEDGKITVFRDGEAVRDDYIKSSMSLIKIHGPVEVGEGEFYFLGDNRNNSSDSSSSRYGYMLGLLKDIEGVAFLRIGKGSIFDIKTVPRKASIGLL
jgi:signal peptidase I